MNNALKKILQVADDFVTQNRIEDAIAYLEQQVVISPDFALLERLGILYAQEQQLAKAIDAFEKALSKQPDEATLHYNLGTAYQRLNQSAKAKQHYEQAIQLLPNYAEAHHNLGVLYDKAQQFQKALKHYSLATQAAPDFTLAHYHLGLLLLKNNQLAAAQTQLQNVITLSPTFAKAYFYLGLIYLKNNQLAAAEKAFDEVLTIDAEDVEALTNRGIVALKKDQPQLAIDYFTKALAFDNDHLEARNNLAATFIHHDRFENALMHYDVLLQKDPKNVEYLYNTGVAQMALGHLNEAMMCFTTLLTVDPDHFAALQNCAAIQIRLGNHAEAIAYLKKAVTVNPKDEASQFMLSALTNQHAAPSSQYIANLFDNYALHYDTHMQKALHYLLPQTIARLLHQLHLVKVKRTADLGCGTGLSGLVIRECSEELIGVDLSAKMLAKAAEKGIYDKLVQDDIEHFLQIGPAPFDLIVAADVLPYVGDLAPLFTAIQAQLTAAGFFIFSHEISSQYPYTLQKTARFAHHPHYIQALCKELQLSVVQQQTVAGRQQENEPLEIMLWVVSQR